MEDQNQTTQIFDSTIIDKDKLELSPNSRIDSYCVINCTGGVEIKGQSVIHAGSHVIGSGGLTMGPRSVITYNAVLLTSTADLRYPASSVVPRDERKNIKGRITLERETFVGANSTIMPDVTVHEGGVVAANSYIDEDIPAWTIRYPDGTLEPREKESSSFPRGKDM